MRLPTYVYFIKPIGMEGPIKIGCSNCPEARLAGLASWSPFRLEIIGRTPGSLSDEGFLHRCFSDSHSHHEWFHFTPLLGETIQRILAASINEVRGSLTPKNRIRRGRKPKSERTESEKLKALTQSKIKAVERRLRKADEKGPWQAPLQIRQIMDRWHGNSFRKIAGIHPSEAELLLVQKFISDPSSLAVVPAWFRLRDPICIPIVVDEVAA